jgi:NADPH:quinone reductase-like Zn-dependent oxidoreductase
MKRAQIRKYGGTEVVEVDENAPQPPLSKGKILVEVHAAGVNPVDWKIREGYLQERAPLEFPAALGGDFSGLVVEVGEGVSGFKKGEEVYGYASILTGGSGSFAEFSSADAKATAPKPKNISHVEAAALPLAGVSAWQALVDYMSLSRGQKILIHGGAGGIGQMAIQLAKHLGAYVATTVSAKDIPYSKELGADEAIDYKGRPFEELLQNFDAVFDTIGGDTYVRSFKALKKGGIIVSMLEQPRSELMEKHGVRAKGQFTQVNRERLSKLIEFAEKGVIKVNVDKTFSLEQVGEALAYLQKGHPRGKVVLKVKI